MFWYKAFLFLKFRFSKYLRMSFMYEEVKQQFCVYVGRLVILVYVSDT